MRDELETGTDYYIDPKFFFDYSSTSFWSWLGCSTVGHWGPKALCLPLAHTPASCPRLTQAVCPLVILLFTIHLLPLFFRLFTQMYLLIDGSVEGQYITLTSYREIDTGSTRFGSTYTRRNRHWNVCLFIISFLLVWAYFWDTFVAFLYQHVYVSSKYSVNVLVWLLCLMANQLSCVI